jgi:predicted ATPase
VLISGEPGIGKSRLAAALAERLAGEPHTRLSYQCSPYHTNGALRPFIAQLERAAHFKADDTPDQRLGKLEAVLGVGASQVATVVPLFTALLSIPLGGRYPTLALNPAQQRRRTLGALLDQFEGFARQQPILLLFEDLQWADATSLELLDLTIERMRQLPVLALFTLRPEFEPPWIGLPNVSTLTLGRLDRSEVESMVGRVSRSAGQRTPKRSSISCEGSSWHNRPRERVRTSVNSSIFIWRLGRQRRQPKAMLRRKRRELSQPPVTCWAIRLT